MYVYPYKAMTSGADFGCYRCGRFYAERTSFCVHCLESGTVVMWPKRIASGVSGLVELATAEELAKATWNEVRLAPYPDLRVGVGALVLVVGPSGSGKSTMTIRALDGVDGPVVFVSGEMGLGPALGSMLGRLGVRRRSFVVMGRSSADAIREQVLKVRAVALGLDSVQSLDLEPDELRRLLSTTTLRALVGISQVNKAGAVHGDNALVHEADVIVRCEALRWSLAKSRYQAPELGGSVLEQGGEGA